LTDKDLHQSGVSPFLLGQIQYDANLTQNCPYIALESMFTGATYA
jgi:hypothetical protein